jgi:hypothetical protein
VTARTPGSTTPYEAAKDKVHDRLMMARFETAYEAYMQDLRKNASIELRVREVPLQLTGPIPEGSLREALEPLAPGAPTAGAAPASAPSAADTTVIPTEKQPLAPAGADEEITTTPQAGPERVTPPPPPAGVPPAKEPPPPGR